jgi:hypothetical protein
MSLQILRVVQYTIQLYPRIYRVPFVATQLGTFTIIFMPD